VTKIINITSSFFKSYKIKQATVFLRQCVVCLLPMHSVWSLFRQIARMNKRILAVPAPKTGDC